MYELIKLLLVKGTDINIQYGYEKNSIYHHNLFYREDIKLAKLLLSHPNGNLNLVDVNGYTPLIYIMKESKECFYRCSDHFICMCYHPKEFVFEYLKLVVRDYRTDLNIKDSDGKTYIDHYNTIFRKVSSSLSANSDVEKDTFFAEIAYRTYKNYIFNSTQVYNYLQKLGNVIREALDERYKLINICVDFIKREQFTNEQISVLP